MFTRSPRSTTAYRHTQLALVACALAYSCGFAAGPDMFISHDTLGTTGVSIIEKENPHLISAINSSILETQKGTQHPTHYAHALAVTAHGHVLTYEWTPQSCQPLCHSIGALYFASQILYLLWSYMQQNCAFTIFIIKNRFIMVIVFSINLT